MPPSDARLRRDDMQCCALMIYQVVDLDDMPLLTQWIKNSRREFLVETTGLEPVTPRM